MTSLSVARFIAVTMGVVLAASTVQAINFFELEAYSAGTRGRGKAHVESFNTVVVRGGREDEGSIFATDEMVRSSLELNYGLTDRLDLALYLDTAKPNGRNLRYAGVRVRGRGPLLFDVFGLFDVGWYAELEFPERHFAEEDAAIELRGIFSGSARPLSVRLNPILEQAFNGPEAEDGPELQYAAAVSYSLLEWLSVELEAFGDFGHFSDLPPVSEEEHYLVPLIEVEPSPRFEFEAGPGFGITRASDDLFVKLVFEYKF